MQELAGNSINVIIITTKSYIPERESERERERERERDYICIFCAEELGGKSEILSSFIITWELHRRTTGDN